MKKGINPDILDLLCDRTLSGLTAEEEAKLRQAAENIDFTAEAESLEFTAAAIAVGCLAPEPLPDYLSEKIIAASKEYFAGRETAEAADVQKVFTLETPTRTRRSFFDWAGWAVAALACIALAVNLYLTRNSVTPQLANVNIEVPEADSLARERERLLASAPDVTIAEWTKGNVKGLENVSGDVVWSDSLQRGYMRFRGLPKNDPNREAYQLWIFDETQSDKTPIDGGVFDVNSDGEVIIPINAKLKARNPKAFAVTIEKPGGVVVSSREKIAALAPVKQKLKQNET
jgi:anti-sigma-K factor RskA